MRQSQRIEREAMERLSDRLSDLPDCVLLHIMKFMNAKVAVQTCVLSKRWKDLWKRLTNLTLRSSDFSRFPFSIKFVSSFLSGRDDSISLHNLDLTHGGCFPPKLLNRVMTYAASHDVQQLMISVSLSSKINFEWPSCIFYCRSLTFLKLCFPWFSYDKIKLPKSLEFLALKSLHIEHVTFTTSGNGCAEPFSTCIMLNTLVMKNCYIQSDAKVLCISNSKLFSLTIINYRHSEKAYQITLSTPNLNLLTFDGGPIHQVSSKCNITCLEEVYIHVNCYVDFLMNGLGLISWLQVLANVKILTLSSRTPEILNALLSDGSIRAQPPCFVRLKSLKLEIKSFSNETDEVVSGMVDYLLQNSPLAGVDIIKC